MQTHSSASNLVSILDLLMRVQRIGLRSKTHMKTNNGECMQIIVYGAPYKQHECIILNYMDKCITTE